MAILFTRSCGARRTKWWAFGLALLVVAVAGSCTPATAQEPKMVIKPPDGYGHVGDFAFAPDGKTLAAGCWKGRGPCEVKLWDVATGKERATLKGHADEVLCVAFAPDGKTLASGAVKGGREDAPYRPCEVKLWDVATGKERATLKTSSAPMALAFTPDGKTLAVANHLDFVTLWDVARGQEIRRLKGEQGMILRMALTSDGTTLAVGVSADGGGVIHLWEVSTGKLRSTLRAGKDEEAGIFSMAFSPDGKILAAAAVDDAVQQWDVATGRKGATLKGHTGGVRSMAFAPDGKVLACGSHRRSPPADELRLWEVATGKLLATRKQPEGFVVKFSPDGTLLVTARASEITLWDVPRLLEAKAEKRGR